MRALVVLRLVPALLVFAIPAFAGWTSGGTTIKSTPSNIPLVKACADGAGGSFVAWQEESSQGVGVLRVQHVQASGDVDPAWPAAGAVACAVATDRTALGALPDHLGGVYLWWREGSMQFVTRIDASAQVAAGWPARGRTLSVGGSPATGIEDGGTGLYLAWTSSTPAALAIHLGPSNTGAGGWPNSPRALAMPSDPSPYSLWSSVALAPDGGIYAACASYDFDGTNDVPGNWQLRRLTPAGVDAPGWTGVTFGSFDRARMGTHVQSAPLATTPDGHGGAFVMIGNPTGTQNDMPVLDTRVYRIASDGSAAAGWPAQGRAVYNPGGYYVDAGYQGSYTVTRTPDDGVLAGASAYYTDSPMMYQFDDYDAARYKSGWSAELAGYERVPKPDGGLFIASYHGSGPYGVWQPNAYLSVEQTHAPAGWTAFSESHGEILQYWYGDIGLAPTPDGGAVLYWSQFNQRFGLFARRFSPAGEVAGVPVHPVAAGLGAAWFARGLGVRARVALPAGMPARLDLMDVSGRRRASLAWTSAGPGSDLTLPGTDGLAAGIYFVSLRWGASTSSARVLVTR